MHRRWHLWHPLQVLATLVNQPYICLLLNCAAFSMFAIDLSLFYSSSFLVYKQCFFCCCFFKLWLLLWQEHVLQLWQTSQVQAIWTSQVTFILQVTEKQQVATLASYNYWYVDEYLVIFTRLSCPACTQHVAAISELQNVCSELWQTCP